MKTIEKTLNQEISELSNMDNLLTVLKNQADRYKSAILEYDNEYIQEYSHRKLDAMPVFTEEFLDVDEGIFSWDENRFLVFRNGSWKIVPRN